MLLAQGLALYERQTRSPDETDGGWSSGGKGDANLEAGSPASSSHGMHLGIGRVKKQRGTWQDTDIEGPTRLEHGQSHHQRKIGIYERGRLLISRHSTTTTMFSLEAAKPEQTAGRGTRRDADHLF